jgi:PAS domain S-box-containing protein
MTLVCVIAGAAVFALDLLRPVGANYGILYLGVILVAAAFVERRTTAILAGACSVLVVIGLVGSAQGVPSSHAIANRVFTILLLWFTALFFGRVRDIARRTLRVAESAPIAVVLAGGDGTIVYVNPATARLFGYAHGELEGFPVENLIPERFRRRHARAFTTFGRDGRNTTFLKNPVLTGLRKDGSEFPLEMQLTALATEGDSLVLCYITDVTDRLQLDSVAEQLTMIRDSSDDAIIGTTIGGIITSWNEAAEQLYGYAAAEVIGRDATELTVPPARSSEIAAIAEQLATTGRVRRFETERMRQDGSLVDVSISMTVVREDGGRPVGTLALIHDISGRKRAEAALRAAHDELETRVMQRTVSLTVANARLEHEIAERHKAQANLRRSERLGAIGTLSAGIAHEINNPLGLIAFELEHARRYGSDPMALAASLGEIEKAVARCASIVSRVLGFARHEATHSAYGDVNEAIRKAIDVTCEGGRRAGIAVRSDLRDDLPPLLMNPVDMEQVLVNLIENALHASAEGGEVLVMSDGDANLMRVRVRDQGRGMNEAEAARACEPFYTTRINEGGTGLGLSICHGIVASYGGVLSIESAPGIGTTVTLEFPVEQGA